MKRFILLALLAGCANEPCVPTPEQPCPVASATPSGDDTALHYFLLYNLFSRPTVYAPTPSTPSTPSSSSSRPWYRTSTSAPAVTAPSPVPTPKAAAPSTSRSFSSTSRSYSSPSRSSYSSSRSFSSGRR